MHVSTCIVSARPKPTHDRILDAAEAIFARDGWAGATTAEIARVAKVNEVTLFRQFGSKDQLTEAVVLRYVQEQQEQLSSLFAAPGELREIVDQFSKAYSRSLKRSVGFIRTMVAESRHRPREVQKVIHGVIRPLRQKLVKLLRDQQSLGRIRPEIDCVAALDLLSGMLFAEAIKPRLPGATYTQEAYRRLAVEIFLRGVQP